MDLAFYHMPLPVAHPGPKPGEEPLTMFDKLMCKKKKDERTNTSSSSLPPLSSPKFDKSDSIVESEAASPFASQLDDQEETGLYNNRVDQYLTNQVQVNNDENKKMKDEKKNKKISKEEKLKLELLRKWEKRLSAYNDWQDKYIEKQHGENEEFDFLTILKHSLKWLWGLLVTLPCVAVASVALFLPAFFLLLLVRSSTVYM
jgi:hypothetical protein